MHDSVNMVYSFACQHSSNPTSNSFFFSFLSSGDGEGEGIPLHNFTSIKGMAMSAMRLRGEIVRLSMSPLGSATGHDDVI